MIADAAKLAYLLGKQTIFTSMSFYDNLLVNIGL